MTIIEKTNLKTWPLWSQVLVVFIIACLLVGYISGKLVRQIEANYLHELQRLYAKKTFQTIISSSIEAIITEDRPVLDTIVKELVDSDEDIYYLSIHNEDGNILAKWENNSEKITNEELLTFSENAVYEGEDFGYIKIMWDTRSLYKDIDTHALKIQTFVVASTLILALVIMTWLLTTVFRPLSRLTHRLDPENFNKTEQIPLSGFLPLEFKRLHVAIDRLKEVSISREELTREVSTRKQAELSAEAARDDAVRANNVKTIFLANMSHELRTPLNAIIGYSDLLLANARQENMNETQEALNTIKISGKYLLEIINSILDFSKIDAEKIQLHLSKIDLIEFINNIKMMCQPLMNNNNNKFNTIISNESDYLLTDSTRLNQILLNLLSNSAKFTRDGEISLTVKCDQQSARFEISDTGIGMTKDETDKIFIPFVQADNSSTREYQGTGLGLAITKRLVELLGGEITVNTKKNVGSTFILDLPNSIDSKQDLPQICTEMRKVRN